MTITSALLCFVLPFMGSYLVSRFMNSTDESIEPPEPKREPIDPDDPMGWNFSEARLRGMN